MHSLLHLELLGLARIDQTARERVTRARRRSSGRRKHVMPLVRELSPRH